MTDPAPHPAQNETLENLTAQLHLTHLRGEQAGRDLLRAVWSATWPSLREGATLPEPTLQALRRETRLHLTLNLMTHPGPGQTGWDHLVTRALNGTREAQLGALGQLTLWGNDPGEADPDIQLDIQLALLPLSVTLWRELNAGLGHDRLHQAMTDHERREDLTLGLSLAQQAEDILPGLETLRALGRVVSEAPAWPDTTHDPLAAEQRRWWAVINPLDARWLLISGVPAPLTEQPGFAVTRRWEAETNTPSGLLDWLLAPAPPRLKVTLRLARPGRDSTVPLTVEVIAGRDWHPNPITDPLLQEASTGELATLQLLALPAHKHADWNLARAALQNDGRTTKRSGVHETDWLGMAHSKHNLQVTFTALAGLPGRTPEVRAILTQWRACLYGETDQAPTQVMEWIESVLDRLDEQAEMNGERL